VRIALDDFGTGYWNLPDLRRLPLHELKLAGSFAVGLQSPCPLVDQRIVAALVDLAHALELTVTAEGIETPAQLVSSGRDVTSSPGTACVAAMAARSCRRRAASSASTCRTRARIVRRSGGRRPFW
jgi:predicted signal transduction protein with EAL and GGDEF domain